MSDVVNKLWGFCHVLRHDGIDYGDYIEQLTYLLFLKMADEKGIDINKKYNWNSILELAGTELLDHYTEILRNLRDSEGILGDIFTKAMPRFTNPVNLKKVINMIDEVDWSSMEVDVKGFLMIAYEWLMEISKGALERKEVLRIKKQTYCGQEFVPRPRRLALMNLFLHGLEPQIYLGDSIYEPERGERYDCILTNPPFGTKGANQAPVRDDFTVSTSNKQLNFIQHVVTILKPGGRAAMVLPDNVLFSDEADDF